jgi:Family of unknown function (DUF5681)
LKESGYLFSTRELIEETTFRLTRVTRIFQKKVFTETTPGSPGGMPHRAFCCATAKAAAGGAFRFIRAGEKAMQFQKGQSGNPAGRPRGSRNRTTILMQGLLADRAEAIGRKVIQLAEDGDMAAIRLCMDRLAPAPKDEPVDIELPSLEKPADSVAAAATIVAGVAAGDLTPSQAGQLAKVIDLYVRAIETKAFDERLSTVEQAVKSPPALGSEGAMHDDACF